MTVYSCNCSPSGAYKLDKFGLKYQVYKSRCNGTGIMSCSGSKEDFKHVMNAITSEFTVAPTFVKQLKNRHKIYAGPRDTWSKGICQKLINEDDAGDGAPTGFVLLYLVFAVP